MAVERTVKPVARLAVIALATAVVASLLALYGSFFSELHLPGSALNKARNRPGLPGANSAAIAFASYVLPCGLGLCAAFAGGLAMRRIEQSGRILAGSRHSVFAIMIGGLAAVVSGCMILAIYVWPHVPDLVRS